VDSSATDLIPQRFNQPANSWSSGVKAWKVRYWLGVSIAWHGYEVLFSTNIDSCRIGIDDRQRLEISTFASIGFALFSGHG